MKNRNRIIIGYVLVLATSVFGDTFWAANRPAGSAWSGAGNWTAGLPDPADRANFTNLQDTDWGVDVDTAAVLKKILLSQNYSFNGTGSITLQPASPAHWDKVVELNQAAAIVVFNPDVTLYTTTDFVADVLNAGTLTFNGALSLTNSGAPSRVINFSGAGTTTINGDLKNTSGMRFASSGLTSIIGGSGVTSGSGGVTLLSGRLELNRAQALINSTIKMEGITLVLGADHALIPGANIDFRSGRFIAEGYDQTFGTLDVATADVLLDMSGTDSIYTFEDSSSIAWGVGRVVITNAAYSTIRFSVDSLNSGTGLSDTQLGQISLNGHDVLIRDTWRDGGYLYIAQFTPVASQPGSAAPVYVGFYRGSEMAAGIYSFTDLTQPLASATRIGSWPFPSPTWESVGVDGSDYFVLNRGTSFGGPGLHRYDGATDLPQMSGSYTFADWHGIGACNDVYYGLYSGAGISGPGLYLFMDPTDPANTGVKIFREQNFSSNVWTDVAFDGERYLFVRTDAEGGTPGIYQYDPNTDSFGMVSGVETYIDWTGLGVFDADIAPLRNKKAYLLLYGGQSNALGWGYRQYLLDTGDPLAMPQGDVDMLYAIAGTGYLPEDTLLPLQSGNSNTNVKNLPNHYPALTNAPLSRFGPELSFARTVRDLINIQDVKVGVAKFAFGGSSLYDMADWRPDGTADRAADGNLYKIFQRTAWRAIAAMKNKYPYHEVEVLGMGWTQGESDAIEGHGEEYEENLTRLVADVRATFGTNLTFVLSKLSTNQLEGAPANELTQWPIVMAAQDAVAAADPKVVATGAEGINYAVSVGYAEGRYHYTTPGLLQIGSDLAVALVSACGVDSDDDGILDSWENSYPPGTAGLGNTPAADYDQDGVTDREEFQTGTSPVDPADRLELSIDASLTGRWSANQDVRYRMQQSSNLISWAEIGSPVLLRGADGIAEFYFLEYTQNNPSGFFRLTGE